jgi:hypothetical protein
MLLVNQGFRTIPTYLLLKRNGTNDANAQSSKSPVVDSQQWACQRGPLLQRRQVVLQAIATQAMVMRVCQSAKAMSSDLMAMTTMMRAMMKMVMTMSLKLKTNASHMCLHEGKRKLAQSGVQQCQQHLVWLYLATANGRKPPGNGTMAMRGAPSGPSGLFVGLMVGVTIESKAMGFVRLTVAEGDASTQVGVERVL